MTHFIFCARLLDLALTLSLFLARCLLITSFISLKLQNSCARWLWCLWCLLYVRLVLVVNDFIALKAAAIATKSNTKQILPLNIETFSFASYERTYYNINSIHLCRMQWQWNATIFCMCFCWCRHQPQPHCQRPCYQQTSDLVHSPAHQAIVGANLFHLLAFLSLPLITLFSDFAISEK